MSRIINISPFINEIVDIYDIECMTEFWNFMSRGLTMNQHLQSDIFWALDEGNLINTHKKSFWIPKSWGIHNLDFYAATNTKISSFSACYIFPTFYP